MSDPASGYEVREHTADVILYAWGATPAGLFRSAAEGFYAILGDLVTSDPRETMAIDLQAPDATDLFHDWLAELLFLFETQSVRLRDIEFGELSETRLSATGRVATVDRARSRFDGEVKAVTYHGLDVRKTAGRFEASVILDL